jgi:transposase InsO family protein
MPSRPEHHGYSTLRQEMKRTHHIVARGDLMVDVLDPRSVRRKQRDRVMDLVDTQQRIRDRPISPRSPWQNAYVERLIGTLRRECLDHVLIYGERHLRRILTLYSLYYNETRTHLGLGKDTPLRRSVQRSGTIVTIPMLSGLHHSYARI